MHAASRRCRRSGIVWSEAVTTTAVGTSTAAIQGAELNRPSSPSTSGIDQALVLRNSAFPHAAGSAMSRDGSSGSVAAIRSTRVRATLDSGCIAAVSTGKKNRSRVAPR